MSGPKRNNGAVMPLALGGLLMVALIASVASDQRYGDTMQPGFNALTAESTHPSADAQQATYQPAIHHEADEPCDLGDATSTLNIKVIGLPAKLGEWARTILTVDRAPGFSI